MKYYSKRPAWLATAAFATLLPALAAAEVKAAENFSWTAFFGPFHMVVLHYPIGFLTLTLLLEVRAIMKPDGGARRAIAFALPLTAFTSVVTAGLGWMRAGAGEFDDQLLTWHRLFGIGVATFTCLAWMLHRTGNESATAPAFRYGYRSFLLAAFASLIAAGHLGGSLTHGAGFLTLNAPPAWRNLLIAWHPRSTQLPMLSSSHRSRRKIWNLRRQLLGCCQLRVL